MADISKEDLKKEITAVLKGVDLNSTSAKKVRQEIEEKLSVDLSSRKKEIDDIVMLCLKESGKKSVKKGAKKNGNKDDDDDDEDKDEDDVDEKEDEDDEDEDEEDEEEKKPKRGAPKKQAAKRKKTSSDESDDASEDKESDEEYSPSKKSKASKGKGKGAAGKGRKKKGSDSDSDEDWGKGKKAAAKKGGGKRGGSGGGYNKTCKLTPELAAVVGQDAMARHEVVKKVWSIIKEQNLYDPKNKQYAICNDDLMKVIGVKRFRTFGMMKYLKKHFVD